MPGFDQGNPMNEKIEKAIKETRKNFSRTEVSEIIRSVMDTLETDNTSAKLYDELDALAHYIESARNDIAQAKPSDIGDKHIPLATDELDAVVGATEEATGEIMDACELIEAVSGKMADGAEKDQLNNAVTNIYEACSFQDITGQRITKVVSALKHIELKVTELLDLIGHETGKSPSVDEAEKKEITSDEDLLNGPSMPGEGIDQDEIDRLLASFD